MELFHGSMVFDMIYAQTYGTFVNNMQPHRHQTDKTSAAILHIKRGYHHKIQPEDKNDDIFKISSISNKTY